MRGYTTVKITRDGKIMLACIGTLGVMLVIVAKSDASTYTPVYSAIHQKIGQHPTLAEASSFNALVGWDRQNIGYSQPYWSYTKGTRTVRSDYPESWYLHKDGVRVRDSVFNLYAMNPKVAGWRDEVARNCPARCFLDGIGPSSIARTKPRITWTMTQWMTAVAGLVRHVVATGKKVLPNSIGRDVALARPILDAAGRGSTEAFTAAPSDRAIIKAGKVWIQEIGGCGQRMASYLLVRGRGDHFACYIRGTLPWTIPSTSIGAPLGKALGKAYRVRNGIRRNFAHGHIIVHPGGTYTITRR